MSAPTEILELQQLVHEKDELLKVLTERLEMAAEQLDRVRRQGGALEPAPAAGAFDDPELTDDLRQMLADWRDLQERGWFGSLEDRVIGLHDLISNLEAAPVRERAEEAHPAASPSVSEILAKYSSASTEPASVENVATESSVEAGDTAADVNRTLELPEAPPSIDIEGASIDELRDALQARESYIVRLKDYLLAYDAATDTSVEHPDLGSLTPEQRLAMEAWESRVRKELRQTQIQLWVERAQLSREQMQMQQLQHQLDTETKRMGIAKQKGAPGRSPSAADSGDNQKNKNWLGLFGNK